MAQWHIDELRALLEKRGWHCVELPGDDRRISATWQLCRPRDPRVFFLDFDGFDDMVCRPIEKSFGVQVRGTDVYVSFHRPRARSIREDGLRRLFTVLEEPKSQL